MRAGLVIAVMLLGVTAPVMRANASQSDPLASLPITAIGCTPANVCVGAAPGNPARFAWSQDGGAWTTATAPALRTSGVGQLSIACSRFGCLLAGASGNHVATWLFDPRTHRISASRWRLAGIGTSSVSCRPSGSCALLSYTEATRTIGYLALSRDGGRRWFAQRPIISRDGWSWTLSITDMTCTDLASCLVVGGSGGTINALGIARTTDGGEDWSAGVNGSLLPASTISCAGAGECFVVNWLDADPSYRLIMTSNAGRTWRHVAAVPRALTGGLACTTTGRCTTGGAAPRGWPWFAAMPTQVLADARALQPVVGCGARWCAAALDKRVIEFRAPGAH